MAMHLLNDRFVFADDVWIVVNHEESMSKEISQLYLDHDKLFLTFDDNMKCDNCGFKWFMLKKQMTAQCVVHD